MISFRVAWSPRYISANEEHRIQSSLLRQRNLWSLLVLDEHPSSACIGELIYCCPSINRGIEIYLRFLPDATDSTGDIKEKLPPVLPDDYGWEVGDIPTGLLSQNGWHITHLARRIELYDLPFKDPESYKQREENVAMPGNTPKTAKESKPTKVLQGPGETIKQLSAQEPYRYIPSLITTTIVRDWGEVTIPFVPRFEEVSGDRNALFGELLGNAPSYISISLHRARPEVIAASRICAQNLLNVMAEHSVLEAANLSLRRFVEQQHFAHCAIRVAASTKSLSRRIALAFASTLGGARNFRIISENNKSGLTLEEMSRRVRQLSTDCCPELLHFANGADVDELRKAVKRRLQNLFIEPLEDDNMVDFFHRLPHLWPLDETLLAIHLPFAFEKVVPGLHLRKISPFNGTAPDPIAVYAPDGKINDPPDGKLRIGAVFNRSQKTMPAENGPSLRGAEWTTISTAALTRHALVVGQTGSGKTRWTLFLCRELHRLGIPFTVIEPVKSEYYAELKQFAPDTLRYRFEFSRSPSHDLYSKFFGLDPMRMPQGSTIARHIGYLKSCFEAAFPIEPVASLILENGLREYYTSPAEKGGCEFNLFKRYTTNICKVVPDGANSLVIPSFKHFSRFFIGQFLLTVVAKGATKQQVEWMENLQQYFRRRFDSLEHGVLGKAFERADKLVCAQKDNKTRDFVSNSLSILLGKLSEKKQVPSVIELDALVDDEHKALVMAFVLSFLYEQRQAENAAKDEGGNVAGLRHVLIVEEAHRLLANTHRTSTRSADFVGESSKAKAVSMFVSMLAEIRALGQGIIIIEQIPTKIASDAVKNTNLKIMLRLASSEDRDYLGQAMGLSEEEKHFAQTLRAREGGFIEAVGYNDEMEDALQMVLPLPKRNGRAKNKIYDEFFP